MGLNKITNKPNNFLTNGYSFWTLTPSHYNGGAYNYYISSNGILSNNRKVSDSIAVRPVISISANTPVIGVGTKDNPYTFSLGGRKFDNICSGGAI